MAEPERTIADDVEWECCDRCHGEGGYHDCGEDTCCCLDPEAIDENFVICEDCNGTGEVC